MASSEAEHLRSLYRAIYVVARRIPRGRIATYGQVAELAGFPGGARVAGAAMKVSRPADRVPWQRVLGKAGKNRARIAIHDPVGAALQRQLLEREGVAVGDSGLVALERYGWLPVETRTTRTTRSTKKPATAGSARAASPRRPPRSGSTRRASSSRR
ncbi:MAG: MGMT family protein [Kofleriaceae bacterium]